MKRIMLVVAALLACFSCNSANDLSSEVAPQVLLVKFAVKVGNNNYNATIDHYAGTVKIGALTHLDDIDGVDYLLADNASISPEPQSFIGNWEKKQTVVVTANGTEKAYDIIFTRYKNPADSPSTPDDDDDVDGPEEGFGYDYRPDFLPKDDECQLYAEPYVAFTAATMPVGTPHPNAELAKAGWKLYTVNEFSDGKEVTREDGSTVKLPFGLYPFDTAMMNESAKVNNTEASQVKNGRLIMKAYRLPETINTGYTNQYNNTGNVDYMHASYRTYPSRNAQMGDWFSLHTNMRFEVRYRRTNTQGFNNAVWFQGNILNVPWPAYGEIDLYENPKKRADVPTMHSTLHSENFYSGNGNAKTATVNLEDMTRWNIYWIELYPEQVVMGVNGQTVLTVNKGENGYTDWPWDQQEGFYLIFSTGMYDKVHSSRDGWMGNVRPEDFADPKHLPSMEFDWVRVYVNDDYDREEAMGVYY